MKTYKELLDLIPSICKQISENAEFGFSEKGDEDWRFNNIIYQDDNEEWWIDFNCDATIWDEEERISINYDDFSISYFDSETGEETEFTDKDAEDFLDRIEYNFNHY